jgi:hypothetical protein
MKTVMITTGLAMASANETLRPRKRIVMYICI